MSDSPLSPPAATADACAECVAHAGRRRFLGELAARAALALAAAGAPRAAAAMFATRPPHFTAPVGRDGRDTRTYPLPAVDGAEIDHENEVIVARWQGAVYAFELACPHQHTALRWLGPEGRFQCPKHKSKYRPDGSFIEGRATRGMDRFGVTRAGDTVVVNLDDLRREDQDAAAWAAAVVRL